jgi:conjugal transfer/type IV secretion protein DotA/TraY
MPFFRDDKKDSQNGGQKQPSLMGFLFKPDIGGSIRPIGESFGVFVKLIAMIFAANGLFPKNHPALLSNLEAGQPPVQLTLGYIITVAWRSLSFTREGIPQILLFLAVVGCLGLAALFVITFMFSLLVGHAHAAAAAAAGTGNCGTPMFQPCDGTTSSQDLAHNWIQYLFLGQQLPSTYTLPDGTKIAQTIAQSQNIQNAFKTALALYSGAILVFAGVILLYHLVHMIAETAHSGTPMGKNANQIWAPIRLVFAIGLLVPIGTSSGGGLNTGQYMMVKMADWGSGLASHVWSTVSTAVAGGQKTFITPPKPQVADKVMQLMTDYACEYAFNYYLSQAKGVDTSALTDDDGVVKERPGPWGGANSGNQIGSNQATITLGNTMPGDQAVCGKYTVNQFARNADPNQTNTNNFDTGYQSTMSTIYTTNAGAFGTMLPQAQALAWNVFRGITEDPQTLNSLGLSGSSDNSTVTQLVYSYNQNMYQSASTTGTNTNGSPVTNSDNDTLVNNWSKLGWVAAGAMFNSLARFQVSIDSAALNDALPIIEGPDLSNDANDGLSGVRTQTEDAVEKFNTWVADGYNVTNANVDQGNINLMGTDAFAGKQITVKPTSILDVLMWIVGGRMQNLGMTDGNGRLNFIIGKTGNPFAELAHIGQISLNAAFQLLGDAALWGAVAKMSATGMSSRLGAVAERAELERKYTKSFVTGALGKAADAERSFVQVLISIAVLIATLLFTVGIMLAFILPLLPFTLFFFNILAWIVSLFEAVVSMPLFALAHLTTKGEGIHGDMAKQGYFFIFSIFLRPVLMVFGLTAGLLIFNIAIIFLNQTFDLASIGSGNWVGTGSFQTLSNIIFSVIYAMFCYICANTCFKTINFFPEHAMRWMTAQGVQTEKMGDKQLMSKTAEFMTAYGFKETVGAAVSKSPGSMLVTGGLYKLASKAGIVSGPPPSTPHSAVQGGGGGTDKTSALLPAERSPTPAPVNIADASSGGGGGTTQGRLSTGKLPNTGGGQIATLLPERSFTPAPENIASGGGEGTTQLASSGGGGGTQQLEDASQGQQSTGSSNQTAANNPRETNKPV